MSAPVPVVHPVDVFPNPSRPGYVLVRVECPYCGRSHLHGGPARDWTGRRTADCDPAGYVLAERTPGDPESDRNRPAHVRHTSGIHPARPQDGTPRGPLMSTPTPDHAHPDERPEAGRIEHAQDCPGAEVVERETPRHVLLVCRGCSQVAYRPRVTRWSL